MNNKKQPLEVFYKKLFLKISQYSQENTVFESLFNQFTGLQASNFIKKRFQHKYFSVNIAKFLKTVILKKICEQLLLNNVKQNYSSMKTVKQVLNVSQHSQENTFTRAFFLINIVVACNFSQSLFKKRFWHWCFPNSYLKFLTTTLPRFLYFSIVHIHSDNGLYS